MSDDTKKQLFMLITTAQEQQESIAQTLAIIKKQQAGIESLHKHLPELAESLFKDSLNDARASLESDLSNHATKTTQELKKASSGAICAADAIKQETKALGWKHAFMTVGAISGTCLVVILGSMFFIPSLDDIAERRATIAQLDKQGGNLDIERCNGKLCARVMTKECKFGRSEDYCVLDLKD
ncbi:hypothetical protein [Psychrobacter celer]|uniref:hypothetical protein n=1 Tax=Psychrobacter celer TaxID=306572 RepID=UPI003FD53749